MSSHYVTTQWESGVPERVRERAFVTKPPLDGPLTHDPLMETEWTTFRGSHLQLPLVWETWGHI
jgi:hypothetical protein